VCWITRRREHFIPQSLTKHSLIVLCATLAGQQMFRIAYRLFWESCSVLNIPNCLKKLEWQTKIRFFENSIEIVCITWYDDSLKRTRLTIWWKHINRANDGFNLEMFFCGEDQKRKFWSSELNKPWIDYFSSKISRNRSREVKFGAVRQWACTTRRMNCFARDQALQLSEIREFQYRHRNAAYAIIWRVCSEKPFGHSVQIQLSPYCGSNEILPFMEEVPS
jgi:hypothetical protein